MSDIIDITGKRVKSKFKEGAEAKRWKPFAGFIMCMACLGRWKAFFPRQVNLFALKCIQCGSFDSWVTMIPKEIEQNFTDCAAQLPPPEPPSAA